jgi:uncharacterized protein (DUF924 family)
MTRDDIIRMTREAGLDQWDGTSNHFASIMERFAALVAAAEREACAEIADKELDNTMLLTSYPPKSSAAWNIRAAIQARGK